MAETYTGQVQNGVVVFHERSAHPPEGMNVRVEPVPAPARVGNGSPTGVAPAERTRAWMLALASQAEAQAPLLPDDLAEHHDHYAHGKPRS